MRRLAIALLVAMAATLGWTAAAQEPEAGRGGAAAARLSALVHGGALAESERHLFEVVFLADAVRVYIYDREGRPLSSEGVSARADIALVRRDAGLPRRANHQATSSTLRHVPANPREGRLRDFLQGGHTLGDEQDLQGIRIDLRLSHLPRTNGDAEVRVELARVATEVVYACPAACGLRFLDPGECRGCGGALERAREGQGEGDRPEEGERRDGPGDRPRGRPGRR